MAGFIVKVRMVGPATDQGIVATGDDGAGGGE